MATVRHRVFPHRPAARGEFHEVVRDLAVKEGMTIVLTTRDLMASRAAAHPGGPELVRFSW